MTRLDRLVLNEIVAPFIGSALLFTGLFFAGGDLIRFAQYLQQGEGIWLVAQMIAYRFPMIIALTFPMAMLLGTLLGFGRLSGDSELIALIAAGIRFERIAAPVAVFGLFVSMIGYWFNQTVVPSANARGEALVTAFKKRGGANPQSVGAFWLPLQDGDTLTGLYVNGGIDSVPSSLGEGSVRLRNISIQEWRNGENTAYTRAKSADWVLGTKRWRLRDGEVISFTKNNTVVADYKDLMPQEVTLDTPDSLAAQQLPVEQVTTSRLKLRADVLMRGGNASQAREAQVEIARRISLPFASLCFALIGAPLGVSSKREGKGLGFAMSVLITFCYWMALQVFSILARGGLLPPYVALMIPNVVCLGTAILLNRRVLRA